MTNFLAGFGIGFGIGMLFAPMRGEDAREMLSVRASELADTARNRYDNARERAESAIHAIRGGMEQRTGTEA